MEVYQTEQSTALTGRRGEKKGVLCQVVLSVKFNGTSQKELHQRTLYTAGFFFSSQIKDKLSSSLNLATDCFFSSFGRRKKGFCILHSSHCHVGQCQ